MDFLLYGAAAFVGIMLGVVIWFIASGISFRNRFRGK